MTGAAIGLTVYVERESISPGIHLTSKFLPKASWTIDVTMDDYTDILLFDMTARRQIDCLI